MHCSCKKVEDCCHSLSLQKYCIKRLTGFKQVTVSTVLRKPIVFSSLHWEYTLSSEQRYPSFEQSAPDDQKYHEKSKLDNIEQHEIHTSGNVFKSMPIEKCMNVLSL